MKVVSVCTSDWANFMYSNMMSLRSVGIDCDGYKLQKHAFGYDKQCEVLPIKQIYQKIKEADLIQIFFSDTTFLPYCIRNNKKIIVYHAGSNYRENSDLLNDYFNPYVYKSVLALGEFWDKGSRNPVYMVGGIDCGYFKRYHNIFNIKKRTFVHYPSNYKIKGTDKILEMMQGYNFIYSKQQKSSVSQYKRMAMSHVYVELFNPTINNNKYGSWGITCLEAASMRRVVVTQNLSNEVYKNSYGESPLYLCDTESEFVENICKLNNMSEQEIRYRQEETYNWVLQKHSLEATGKYWLTKIL